MEIIINDKTTSPLISIILVDWSVRESFHSLKYLNNQTFPREKYEIIWIEFYDRKPLQLQEAVGVTKILDKWVILGNSTEIYYHKHLMYNIGIIMSDGNICVICDSDAIFAPTFVENIFNAFNAFKIDPNIVVHLDEVRNVNEKFYPFNYPGISEIIGKGCINWTGRTTVGLNNSSDILHDVNYGACMCALKKDLIEIGGSDEHIDYIGHICGPYEMTFRLVNHGKHEKWLSHEWLYHVWHHGEAGDKNFGGPHDGRGVSLRALEVRKTCRIKPFVENSAIKELREGTSKTREELISMLEKQDRTVWKKSMAVLSSVEPAKLVEENYFGFNIISHKGLYYGLLQEEGAFDPIKVESGGYKKCYSGKSAEEVMEKINSEPVRNILSIGGKIKNAFKSSLGRAGQSEHLDSLTKEELSLVSQPLLVQENHLGFNIIYYNGLYYGLEQEEGPFDITKVINKEYKKCYSGRSAEEVMEKINSESLLKIYRSRWALTVGRNIKNKTIKNAIIKSLNWIKKPSIRHQIEEERAAVATLQGELESERAKVAAEQRRLEEERLKVSAQEELVEKGRQEGA